MKPMSVLYSLPSPYLLFIYERLGFRSGIC